MKRLFITAIVIFACVHPTYASIINGGFETGDLSGWMLTQSAANCNVRADALEHSSEYDTGPYEGNYYAELTSHTAEFYDLSPSILS